MQIAKGGLDGIKEKRVCSHFTACTRRGRGIWRIVPSSEKILAMPLS